MGSKKASMPCTETGLLYVAPSVSPPKQNRTGRGHVITQGPPCTIRNLESLEDQEPCSRLQEGVHPSPQPQLGAGAGPRLENIPPSMGQRNLDNLDAEPSIRKVPPAEPSL